MTDYPNTLQSDLAAHPLEMFEITAWEHAFDELNYELLLRLSEDMPVSVMYALCVFAECLPPLNICDGIAREASQRAIGQWIHGWIANEQERLQREAIERIYEQN